MKNPNIMAMTAAGLMAVSTGLHAWEQGDIIVRAGIATVVPNDESDAIVLPTDPPTVFPNGVGVENGTALGIMGVWMFQDTWGVELLAATPFEHDIELKDVDLDAGSTKHLPPTVSLQWYPRGGLPGWQPYLGLGVNYTTFFSEDVDTELGVALGILLDAESAKLSLDDSYGWTAQAGVDIPINDKWAFNLGVWYIDLGTEADIDVTTVGGARARVSFDVDIDPWVYNIGVAYKF